MNEEASVKTEPGEWKSEHGNFVLPVQCDIVKPKMIKLCDGTVVINGQPQTKRMLSAEKQAYQKLPAYVTRVFSEEIFQ